MLEQNKTEQAIAVYNTLCQVLDKHEWKYQKEEEKLSINCSAQGDDLPMEITVRVDKERMLVMLISHMPFVVQEDKRLDIAIAVSAINNLLVDGCFDYDVTSGFLFFRMTNSYIESKIGEEVFAYMLYCSCHTIDEYNDKIFMLAKGMISIDQFLSAIEN